jgi:hypothetical protein
LSNCSAVTMEVNFLDAASAIGMFRQSSCKKTIRNSEAYVGQRLDCGLELIYIFIELNLLPRT